MSLESMKSDDEFAHRLEVCEQLLEVDQSGESLRTELDCSSEIRHRLEKGIECVKRLKQLWPGCGIRSYTESSDLEHPWSKLPANVGRFALQRELGRGAYGVVFLARDPQLNRDVALKLPRLDVLVDPKLRERFAQEARAAAALDHPNIVQVYEAGELGPLSYIASAYCAGLSLAEWLKQHTDALPTPNDAATLVAALADGTQHAHQTGILHRDLKPGNVLLTRTTRADDRGAASDPRSIAYTGMPSDPRKETSSQTVLDSALSAVERSNFLNRQSLRDFVPKITDFGLAKIESDVRSASMTQSGAILGTPNYMAPEQACGQNKDVSPASDVYALGAILYELLTGRPPFQGSSAWDTLQQVQTREPTPLSKLRWKMPRDLETICLKCLAKSPSRRYCAARELADDLRRFLQGQPILARPTSQFEHLAKWSQRNPLVAALTAAMLLVTMIGFAAVTWQWRRADSALAKVTQAFNEKAAALSERDRALGEKAEALAQQQLALLEKDVALKDKTNALKDKELALAEEARQRANAEENDYVHLIASANLEWQKSNSRGALERLDQCPARERNWEWMYLKNLVESDLLSLKGDSNRCHGLAVSPDGELIAISEGVWGSSLPGVLRIWELASGRMLAERISPRPIYSLRFLADGSKLVTASASVQFWRLDQVRSRAERAELEEVTWLKGDALAASDIDISSDGRLLAVGHWNSNLTLWNLETGDKLRELKGHSQFITSVHFSPDNARIATGCRDGMVNIFDVASGEKKLSWLAHTDTRRVAFSPNGELLISAGYDAFPKVWNAQTGELLSIYSKHEHVVHALRFKPDGRHVVSGDRSGLLRVWDPLTGLDDDARPSSTGQVSETAFLYAGRVLAAGGASGQLKLWDLAENPHYRRVSSDDLIPKGVSISYDSHWTSFGTGNALKLAPLRSNSLTPKNLTLPVHPAPITDTAWGSHDRLLTCCADGVARVWQVSLPSTNKEVGASVAVRKQANLNSQSKLVRDVKEVGASLLIELKGHAGSVSGGVWLPKSNGNDRTAVTYGKDKTIRIWDVDSGHVVRSLDEHKAEIVALAAAAQGKRIASLDEQGRLLVWDVATHEVIAELHGKPEFGWGLAISGNGQWVAAAGDHFTIQIWNLEALEIRKSTHADREAASHPSPDLELVGHTSSVNSLSFSPDGTRLVSGGNDDMARLWSFPSGHPLLPLACASHVGEALFTPDSTGLITSSPAIILWDSQSDNKDIASVVRRLESQSQAWHERELKASIGAQQWFSAEFHLNALFADERDANRLAELRHQRGYVRASQSRWSEAAEDYAHPAPGELTANTIYFRAILALELEDLAAYEQICREAIAQFCDTKNPSDANAIAWMCALVPAHHSDERDRSNRGDKSESDSILPGFDSPDTTTKPITAERIKAAVALAEFAVRTSPHSRSYVNTLAFALLRAGRIGESIAQFEKSHSQNAYPEDYAGLALCLHRLNQSKLALERAAQWRTAINRQTPPGHPRLVVWHEQLSRRLLDRELNTLQYSNQNQNPN